MFDRSLVARCEGRYADTHHIASAPSTLVLAPGLLIDTNYCGYWSWGRPSRDDRWADLGDVNRGIRPDFDPLVDEVRDAHLAAPGGHP